VDPVGLHPPLSELKESRDVNSYETGIEVITVLKE
jgi:hypothetical protein